MLKLSPTLKPIDAKCTIPGSKYVANRILMIAALSKGESVLKNLPDNEDINTMIDGLKHFGIKIDLVEDSLVIHGLGGELNYDKTLIYTSASGTFSRFLLPFAALANAPVEIDGNKRMRERPMGPLIEALRALGVKVDSPNNALPCVVQGPLKGGVVGVEGNFSSQYFSGLLMAAAASNAEIATTINVVGELVSSNYIDLTVQCMAKFNVTVENDNYKSFSIKPHQSYRPTNITIEADPVSSTYFFAAAAMTKGKVEIASFNENGAQGESRFPYLFESYGAKVINSGDTLRLNCENLKTSLSSKKIIDMGNMPDAVQTFAVFSAFVDGVTRITNIAHLKYKESDRIGDTATELRKLGIHVESGDDYLEIHGNSALRLKNETIIDCHDDHRMAMSFSLAGLIVPGVTLKGEHCVAKSFPEYFTHYNKIGGITQKLD